MIILTGFAGFIGSHLGEYLAQKESLLLVDQLNLLHQNRYFDPQKQNFWEQARDMEPTNTHKLLDCIHLAKLLKKQKAHYHKDTLSILPLEENISAVVHMGAITNTSADCSPEELKKMNTEYSMLLWNWCTNQRVPFYYASSAATYGLGERGFSDDHKLVPKLKPLNPYATSKQAFDTWVLEQEKKGKSPPHWYGFKFFNVFGPREAHKGPMASTIFHSFQHIQKHGTCPLFRSHREDIKDGEQKRDFIYISDLVEVFHFFLEKKAPSGIYNLGTGTAHSFYAMAQALFSLLQKDIRIDWIDTPKAFQASYQYFTQAELSKLRKAGFQKNFLSLEEGVGRYVNYLKDSYPS